MAEYTPNACLLSWTSPRTWTFFCCNQINCSCEKRFKYRQIKS